MYKLIAKYGFYDLRKKPLDDLDVVVVLGGDGFMLRMLHRFSGHKLKIYGVNCGSVGFLLNKHTNECIVNKIESATVTELHPLSVHMHLCSGEVEHAIAFNETYVMRSTCQAAKIKLFVDGVERINSLVADGVMLATPAGSTAYNISAGGMALPINSQLYALTPICTFRPRRWPGAIIPDTSIVEFEITSPLHREVSGFADFIEFHKIAKLRASMAKNRSVSLLFDSNHSLEERIIREQFIEV